MTTDTIKIAELTDALLDIKQIAGKSGDHDIDPWALLDLIADSALTALGQRQTRKCQMVIPADPEKMNAERAEWAAEALRAFQRATGADDEDALGDLLCDLVHWSDRNGFNFYTEFRRAQTHYEVETTPDEV